MVEVDLEGQHRTAYGTGSLEDDERKRRTRSGMAVTLDVKVINASDEALPAPTLGNFTP